MLYKCYCCLLQIVCILLWSFWCRFNCKRLIDLLILVRHHLNGTAGQTAAQMCSRCIQQKKICRCMYADFGLFHEENTFTVWVQRGWCGKHIQMSLFQKKYKEDNEHWHSAVYSTININRPREDWSRQIYGHKRFTFEWNIQCRMEKRRRNKNPASQFYIWQVSH